MWVGGVVYLFIFNNFLVKQYLAGICFKALI